MQNVMDQWREYTTHKAVFENTEYITGTLGIALPVTEGGSAIIPEELRSQIIQEHLLFEGFLDSMKDWLKAKSGEIPNLFKTIYKIMKDPRLVEDFQRLIMKKVVKPVRQSLEKLAKQIKPEQVGRSIQAYVISLYNVASKHTGWMALVATMALAVLFKKALDMGVEKLAEEGLKTLFGPALVQAVISQVTDFNNWLTALSAGVGGISIVASALAPATEIFLQTVAESFKKLNEKASSKAQQKYFGMLKKCKEDGDCPDEEVRKKADSMTIKQIDDFAGTKHKGLPARKDEELRSRIKEAILGRLAEAPAKGKKYSKTVTNPETGRKKKVSYGAKGYRIAPGTSKGDSYCARSYGIKKGLSKDKQNDPNTPNNLSRKKWKCRGKKSMKEEYTTEEIRHVVRGVFETLLQEEEETKKDACYYRVKDRYKVFPSAYASGALVQCRDKGAENWGNSDEKNEIRDIVRDMVVSYLEEADFDLEKKRGMKGWFDRQGAAGSEGGWVDCKTCRKDKKTGRKKCSQCAQGDRKEKPYCRPKPSDCGK